MYLSSDNVANHKNKENHHKHHNHGIHNHNVSNNNINNYNGDRINIDMSNQTEIIDNDLFKANKETNNETSKETNKETNKETDALLIKFSDKINNETFSCYGDDYSGTHDDLLEGKWKHIIGKNIYLSSYIYIYIYIYLTV
jgi:hypothetical protein